MGSIVTNLTQSLDLLKYINPFDKDFILNGVISSIGIIIDYLNPTSENFILGGLISTFGDVFKYINPASSDFLLNGLIKFFNPDTNDFIFKGLFGDVSGIFDGLGQVIDWLNPLSENFFVYKLIELLGNLFSKLFIPSEGAFEGFEEVFKEKVGFIDVLGQYIEKLKTNLDGKGAKDLPKLTVNVDCSYYTGSVTVFDCSWIEPYKKYTDLIICGFAYLGFMWRLYKRIPSIISGTGVFGRSDD